MEKMSKNLAQVKSDKLLEKWDIEAKAGAKNLLLAYLIKSYPKFHATTYDKHGLTELYCIKDFQTLKLLNILQKSGEN